MEANVIEILKKTKTIAVVGLSSKKHKPAYYVPAYLRNAGYKIIPVNPHLDSSFFGSPPVSNLVEIQNPVDMVLLFQRSEVVEPFVTEAVQIGAKYIWMQLGIRNDQAAAFAIKNGLGVVMDRCMMVDHQIFSRT